MIYIVRQFQNVKAKETTSRIFAEETDRFARLYALEHSGYSRHTELSC